METNLLDLKATSGRLRMLATRGHLNRETLARAFRISGQIPGGEAWEKFLNYALLTLGAAFTLSGVFFFFAYNWADMHHYLKFGLIEAAILVTAGLASYLGLGNLPGKAALTAAAILVGALLVVFGQVYQTGADAYQLFLNWAGLIAGWVIISTFTPLWFGLLALLNLSLILYWDQVLGGATAVLYIILYLLNAASLFTWEYAHHRGLSWLTNRWFPRAMALATFTVLVIPTLEFIFSNDLESDRFLILAPILYTTFTLFSLFFYSQKIRELLILTIASLTIIIVVSATVVEIFEFDFDSSIPYLILSLIIIGQAALAVTWLRKVAKVWEGSK